ncbi:hypothetical protein PM082_010838 [Marasmius tenuissimus]|nr:hypothetical protein PM082_010838 [Marasmius tenuissimus]
MLTQTTNTSPGTIPRYQSAAIDMDAPQKPSISPGSLHYHGRIVNALSDGEVDGKILLASGNDERERVQSSASSTLISLFNVQLLFWPRVCGSNFYEIMKWFTLFTPLILDAATIHHQGFHSTLVHNTSRVENKCRSADHHTIQD